MYCPRCGTENNDAGVRFCRNCGEDLRLMLQVMSKPTSWHIVLARQVEEYLASKKQRNAESGAAFIVSSLLFLMVGIINAFTLGWQWAAVTLIGSLIFAMLGAVEWRRYKSEMGESESAPERVRGDLSVYRRGLNKSELQPRKITAGTAPVPPAHEAGGEASPPASVTENTTRQLGARPKATKESR